jgi:hypothetical protein
MIKDNGEKTMGTMAKKPFYVSDKIGLFKFVDSPGYGIKIMGVGRSGLDIGECDNKFNLLSITNYDKKELVLCLLTSLRFESYKAFKERFNPKMLTSHFKITKTLNIDI